MAAGRPPNGQDELRRKASAAFIDNLERLRTASGLSQENLSFRASLSRSHVGRLENGDGLPEIDTVYKLAGALGVEPRELLPAIYWRPGEPGKDGSVTDEPPSDPYKEEKGDRKG
jgi:transcriptional regulator with XRE-family HTH domain